MGLHIIGMGADEMLQGFGVAIQVRCKTVDCGLGLGFKIVLPIQNSDQPPLPGLVWWN